MKVWITKYALSSGIFEANAEICANISQDMIRLTREGRYEELFHGEGKDWHLTEEGARERLKELKERKVRSLLKQISKIESIKF